MILASRVRLAATEPLYFSTVVTSRCQCRAREEIDAAVSASRNRSMPATICSARSPSIASGCVPAATWIRTLGKRMVKFDFKGYSHKTGFKTPIGEGDENWPEVLKALADVGYDGWATSEVSGGGEPELTDIYNRMAKALGKA